MARFCLLTFGLIFLLLSQSQSINIGGIFDPLYPSEYSAFLQAIADINSADIFDGITLNASYIIESSSSNMKETANMLATDVSIVIGPRYSQQSSALSPLFELSKTPYISYRASASDLSDRITFPYFFRIVPDVLDIATPIIALFKEYGWEQGVLIHSSGHWGRGLNYLVHIGAENGIIFKVIGIPDGYTVDMISSQLSLLTEYEIFVLHVPSDQRANIYSAANNNGLIKEGIAWIGTADIAVDVERENTQIQQLMEGSLAIRPITPSTEESKALIQSIASNSNDWYPLFVYDAVVAAAYALRHTQNDLSIDITQKTALNQDDYFGAIQYYLSNGDILSDSLSKLQLGSDWSMTGSIYLRDNTRKMPYQLVNLKNGEWQIVAEFNWNSHIIDDILSNDSYCNSLSNTARDSSLDQYTQLTTSFAIKDCSLFTNFTSSKRCNADVISFYNECLRPVMGLDTIHSSSKRSDDFDNSNWFYSSTESISWINSSTSIPIGAQFSKSNPLRVLVHIIEPWGKWSIESIDLDDSILGFSGFLPALWNYLISAHDLNCIYFDGSGYSEQEALNALSSGEYDVALGAFTITSSRSSRIRFLHQFYGGGQRILTFDPNAVNDNAWFFLAPLSNWLWMTWLIAIVAVAHLLWIMEWDTPTFKEEDEDTGILKRMPYSSAILEALTISTSVLYFTHSPPRGKHSRWFIAVWEYIVLILISAYTANMVSFITNSSAVDAVIDDESSLYLQDTFVITVPNTASADILEAANISYTPCDSADICLEMMYNSLNTSLNNSNEEYYNAFVYDDLNVEYWARTSTECSLITGGSPFNSFSAAIATRYEFIPKEILESIDLLIIKLWSNGTITNWMEQFISSDYPCDAFQGAVDETTPLDVISFYPLWILIGAGSIIFCTVVICTVERSKTPIDQQLQELNKLIQRGGHEQITRVGTLSSRTATPMHTAATPMKNVDLYDDKQIEMQKMSLKEEVIQPPKYEEQMPLKQEYEEQMTLEEEEEDEDESPKYEDVPLKEEEPPKYEEEMAVKEEASEHEELKKYETPKGKAGLEALSTLAMDIDPFEAAFKTQDSRNNEKKKQNDDDDDDKLSKADSLKIETEYEDEDDEKEKEKNDDDDTQQMAIKEEELKKYETPKGKAGLEALSTLAMGIDPFEEAFKKQDSRNNEKRKQNDDDNHSETDSVKIETEFNEDEDDQKEKIQNLNTLSDEDINDAFDDNN